MGRRVHCRTRGLIDAEGCDWTGALKDLDAHQLVCEFTLVDCKYRETTQCDCVLKPRREAPEYFYTRAEYHQALFLRKVHSGKRRREDEHGLAAAVLPPVADTADKVVEAAAVVAEAAPDREAEAGSDAPEDSQEKVPAPDTSNTNMLPASSSQSVTAASATAAMMTIPQACAALEALLSVRPSRTTESIETLNVELSRLLDLLPAGNDGTAEARSLRKQVSTRVVTYAEEYTRQAGSYDNGSRRSTLRCPGTDEEVKRRTVLCRELIQRLQGSVVELE